MTTLAHSQTKVVNKTIARESSSLISLDPSKLVLLFALGSVAGLIIEVIYHGIVFGDYENRFGLVWGPFSPLYGAGVVVLTIALNRLWHQPGAVIFIASAVLGSTVEFACSWWMESFFGAVAWDYSGTFMNIDGRVNLMFALMWGALGLAWIRLVMPLMNRGFERIEWKSLVIKIATTVLSLFLLVNITLTVQAFERESQRSNGVVATSNVDVFFDEYFSTEWMQNRFANMSFE